MPFTLPLGQPAPNFSLPGIDGKTYSLSTFKDSPILVVFFTCNHCPYVVNSLDRQKQFYNDYSKRGVALIGINSNEDQGHPDDSFDKMKEFAPRHGITWPYVRDESQETALAYGALRTPHYYVFDKDRKLRYTGRMDDNPRNPGQEKTHELRDAVDALLAGNRPPVELTNPIGCNVKWQGKENHWMPPDACDLV
jgi:peroxiredoxin